MQTLCNKERCTGCTACLAACPQNCIRMVPDPEGFLRPEIDAGQCIDCGKCVKACPLLGEQSVQREYLAFAAINPKEETRRRSTSGGVFFLLGNWVLEQGGAVWGAAYDGDFSVVHIPVEHKEDLHRLQGAKYAQSMLGDAFRGVKAQLEDGRWVLFSGTPCQVGGLRSFLGKDYERLLLVDVICHGIPSPEVWRAYIRHRSGREGGGTAPTAINLRSKESGWPQYSIRFDFANGGEYLRVNREDAYLRAFVGDLCLRPSCYQCQFKGEYRPGDITLGDYWGVWSQLPEYNDGKGTSLVLVNTEKGSACWSAVAEDLRYQQVAQEICLEENPSACRSAQCPEHRTAFMSRFETEDFDALLDELRPIPAAPPTTPLWKRVARRLMRF